MTHHSAPYLAYASGFKYRPSVDLYYIPFATKVATKAFNYFESFLETKSKPDHLNEGKMLPTLTSYIKDYIELFNPALYLFALGDARFPFSFLHDMNIPEEAFNSVNTMQSKRERPTLIQSNVIIKNNHLMMKVQSNPSTKNTLYIQKNISSQLHTNSAMMATLHSHKTTHIHTISHTGSPNAPLAPLILAPVDIIKTIHTQSQKTVTKENQNQSREPQHRTINLARDIIEKSSAYTSQQTLYTCERPHTSGIPSPQIETIIHNGKNISATQYTSHGQDRIEETALDKALINVNSAIKLNTHTISKLNTTIEGKNNDKSKDNGNGKRNSKSAIHTLLAHKYTAQETQQVFTSYFASRAEKNKAILPFDILATPLIHMQKHWKISFNSPIQTDFSDKSYVKNNAYFQHANIFGQGDIPEIVTPKLWQTCIVPVQKSSAGNTGQILNSILQNIHIGTIRQYASTPTIQKNHISHIIKKSHTVRITPLSQHIIQNAKTNVVTPNDYPAKISENRYSIVDVLEKSYTHISKHQSPAAHLLQDTPCQYVHISAQDPEQVDRKPSYNTTIEKIQTTTLYSLTNKHTYIRQEHSLSFTHMAEQHINSAYPAQSRSHHARLPINIQFSSLAPANNSSLNHLVSFKNDRQQSNQSPKYLNQKINLTTPISVPTISSMPSITLTEAKIDKPLTSKTAKTQRHSILGANETSSQNIIYKEKNKDTFNSPDHPLFTTPGAKEPNNTIETNNTEKAVPSTPDIRITIGRIRIREISQSEFKRNNRHNHNRANKRHLTHNQNSQGLSLNSYLDDRQATSVEG